MSSLSRSPRSPGSPIHRSSVDSLRDLELTQGSALSPYRATHLGGLRRSSANSSAISLDFRPELLPLSLSSAGPDRETGGDAPAKTIGLWNGVALVIGLQIGSGIFSSPGVVVANASSVGASLVVWVVGGLLAWTGARHVLDTCEISSFAELGTMIPLNGGAQAYLAYAYSPLVSYLYTWTAVIVLKPGGNAIILLIFGEYLNRVIFHTANPDAAPDAIAPLAIKLTAVVAVLIIAVLCVATPKLGTRTAVFFTVIKFASLIAVAVLGLIQIIRGKASTSLTEAIFAGTSPNPSSYALALYSTLWAYDGWDQTNYVAGEMKNIDRDLPRVIHISMISVMVLFLAANVSYFAVLPKGTVERSNTIALDFGRALFGNFGALVFAGVVAISCFGATNGSMFTTARLIYSAAREGYLPSMFGRLHKGLKTPLNAMVLQVIITLFYILIGGGFRTMINFVGVAAWTFYFLTGVGLIVLRVKEPGLPRQVVLASPYKAWIITPLIFSGVSLFLLLMPIFAAPLEALAAFAFIVSGVPFYFISMYFHDPNAVPRPIRWIGNRIGGLFGRKASAGAGYMRAATDGDETVEMIQR
ncbi:amino acid permease [Rhizoctonia solani]|uniref:Amino acid permease n=2 Tax=Rhizoctonia solani TaxID=456999 RepID=A0A8H8PCN0_9AGAM|nr:amino acid permease [Rhizoctonia solani]QRW27621.1 amino acid permease [Rhizoctonia solani]